jgi:hypothetical protein
VQGTFPASEILNTLNIYKKNNVYFFQHFMLFFEIFFEIVNFF